MYERLLDKNSPPDADFIKVYIGAEGDAWLLHFEEFLNSSYDIRRELKFPFGSQYGWGYKYSHKASHLCYVFIERGAITVTLQLGDACVAQIDKTLPGLSRKANELWKHRYKCGAQGGWVHYRVLNADELNDVIALVKIKRKPMPV